MHDCILRNYYIDEANHVTAIDIGESDYIGHLGNVLSVMIKEAKVENYESFKEMFVQFVEDYENHTNMKLDRDEYVEALKYMIKTPYEHSSSDSKLIVNQLKNLYGVSTDKELMKAMKEPSLHGELDKILDKWEPPYLRNMKQIQWTLQLLLEYEPDLSETVTPLKKSLEEIIKNRIRITGVPTCPTSFTA